MFTRLVETVGELVERKPTAGGFRLRIATPLVPEMKAGDSLAVNGVCLTVAGLGSGRVDVQIVPYTQQNTKLGAVQIRDRVNVECDSVGKHVVRAAEFAGLSLSTPLGDVTH